MTKEDNISETAKEKDAEKKNKKESPNHQENIGVTSALLDFYSDRATSFASLLVASIFGIVTLAAIIQAIENNIAIKVISLFPYIAFSYAGYYNWGRFTSWAGRADYIERLCIRDPHKDYLSTIEFLKEEGSKELTNMCDYLHDQAENSNKRIVRRIITKKGGFELIYFSVIVTLAIVAYI